MTEELEQHIAKKMTNSIEEEFTNDLFGYFLTHTNINNETLALENFQELIYLVYPKLYYATATYCQKGQIYFCKETEYNPEYILFHPDDFEKVKKGFKERILVHIKDESKEKILKRLLKNLKIKPLIIGELDE